MTQSFCGASFSSLLNLLVHIIDPFNIKFNEDEIGV